MIVALDVIVDVDVIVVVDGDVVRPFSPKSLRFVAVAVAVNDQDHAHANATSPRTAIWGSRISNGPLVPARRVVRLASPPGDSVDAPSGWVQRPYDA